MIIDGTLIVTDRIALERPFYSGKHRHHGVNLRVISAHDGDILWISGDLPGSTYDATAARIWQILPALASAGLNALADKGYQGLDDAGNHVITPHKGKSPDSQKAANRAHAQLKTGPSCCTRPRRLLHRIR